MTPGTTPRDAAAESTAATAGRWRRFWPYLRPFRRAIGLLFGSIVITILINLPTPWLEKLIIDEAIPQRDLGRLGELVAVILGLFLAYRLLLFARNALSISVKQQVLTRVRMSMFEHLERMSPAFFARHPSGQLLSRITSDVGYVQNLMNDELFEVVASGLKVIITIALLLTISTQLTLLSAIVLPVVTAVFLLFRRKVYTHSRALQESQAKLSAKIQQSVVGMKLIQAEVIESEVRDETLVASRELERVGVRREVLAHGGNLLTVVFSYLPIVGVIWGVGGYFVIQGSLTLGGLLAFTQYLFGIVAPVTRFFQFNMNLQTGYAALDRIYEILDEEPDIVAPEDAIELEPPILGVEFAEVSLSFGSEGQNQPSQALDHVSFTIRAGEKVAIVGPSGAGKTSIANLLLRFCDPTSGRVLVQGQPVSRYTLSSLRRSIGYVAQEVFLFQASVRHNLTLGRPHSAAQIAHALEAAQAADFVAALDGGLDAEVDEQGANFSGGERQRLALARLLLKDASLVVLDEATSALDSQSEQRVWTACAEAFAERTVLVIAHRFTMLDWVDRVLVFAEGRLVEQGSVAELLERQGLFHALYHAQQ